MSSNEDLKKETQRLRGELDEISKKLDSKKMKLEDIIKDSSISEIENRIYDRIVSRKLFKFIKASFTLAITTGLLLWFGGSIFNGIQIESVRKQSSEAKELIKETKTDLLVSKESIDELASRYDSLFNATEDSLNQRVINIQDIYRTDSLRIKTITDGFLKTFEKYPTDTINSISLQLQYTLDSLVVIDELADSIYFEYDSKLNQVISNYERIDKEFKASLFSSFFGVIILCLFCIIIALLVFCIVFLIKLKKA